MSKQLTIILRPLFFFNVLLKYKTLFKKKQILNSLIHGEQMIELYSNLNKERVGHPGGS